MANQMPSFHTGYVPRENYTREQGWKEHPGLIAIQTYTLRKQKNKLNQNLEQAMLS